MESSSSSSSIVRKHLGFRVCKSFPFQTSSNQVNKLCFHNKKLGGGLSLDRFNTTQPPAAVIKKEPSSEDDENEKEALGSVFLDHNKCVLTTSISKSVGWTEDVKTNITETTDSVFISFEIPELKLEKNDFEVFVVGETLTIAAWVPNIAVPGYADKGVMKRKTCAFNVLLQTKLCKLYGVKAYFMENGVMKVVVPKLKEGERTDLVNVPIY